MVKWNAAEIISQQPGYDSRPGKATKNLSKTTKCAFNDRELQGVLKKCFEIFFKEFNYFLYEIIIQYFSTKNVLLILACDQKFISTTNQATKNGTFKAPSFLNPVKVT